MTTETVAKPTEKPVLIVISAQALNRELYQSANAEGTGWFTPIVEFPADGGVEIDNGKLLENATRSTPSRVDTNDVHGLHHFHHIQESNMPTIRNAFNVVEVGDGTALKTAVDALRQSETAKRTTPTPTILSILHRGAANPPPPTMNR